MAAPPLLEAQPLPHSLTYLHPYPHPSSFFFRDENCSAVGAPFVMSAGSKGPWATEVLRHGAISAQLGGIGYHGFQGLAAGERV